MIDIAYFQTLLLLVCLMAFLGSLFAGYIITSKTPWLHALIKLFFAALAIMGGMSSVLLVLLK